jgi:hypothetical protein
MPDIDFKVTNKHNAPDKFLVEVRKTETGVGNKTEIHGKAADHKKPTKKGKKPNVEVGNRWIHASLTETTGLERAIAATFDVGTDIQKLRVHLSPLGIGHKLRLEIKVWGSDAEGGISDTWQSQTTYNT